ncbi:hypothetical protein [Streptomyces sp. NPDC001999]
MRSRVGLPGAAAGAALLAALGIRAWPEERDEERRRWPGQVPTDLRERDPEATLAARQVYAMLAGLENSARATDDRAVP